MLSLDQRLEIIVVAHRDALLNHLFVALTFLGDARIIAVVTISLLIVLWRHKRYAYKVGLLVALFGSLATSYILKIAIERPRPPLALQLIHESSYSFPSMHAAVSMATYGFLIYIIWKLVHPPHHRLPAAVLCAALIFLIGCSRIYLGVHYLTDVLGGFAIGALFVYIGILVTRSLSVRKGRAR